MRNHQFLGQVNLRLGADAPAPAPSPAPASSFDFQYQPSFAPDYYPIIYPNYPYAYPPRMAYDAQVQYPTVQAPTVVTAPAAPSQIPTAIYVVGGAAVLLGAIALMSR